MAKVGTAHVEIKPVLNRDALDEMCAIITKRVAEAVNAGLRPEVHVATPSTRAERKRCPRFDCPRFDHPDDHPHVR